MLLYHFTTDFRLIGNVLVGIAEHHLFLTALNFFGNSPLLILPYFTRLQSAVASH